VEDPATADDPPEAADVDAGADPGPAGAFELDEDEPHALPASANSPHAVSLRVDLNIGRDRREPT
jgi:hypothetical protein